MASAIGQQGPPISAQGALTEALGDPTSVWEGIRALTSTTLPHGAMSNEANQRMGTLSEVVRGKNIPDELKGLRYACNVVCTNLECDKETLFAKYREELSDYCPSDFMLDDASVEMIIRLEGEFIKLVAEYHISCPSEYFTQILEEAEHHGHWVKVYLLCTYTRCFTLFWEEDNFEHQKSLDILINEIKECIKDNPIKFELQNIINECAKTQEVKYQEVVLLQLEYQALPKELTEATWLEALDATHLPQSYDFFLKHGVRVDRSALVERDQKEVDRFHSIFNRIDFVLVWKEKAVSKSGVGILPSDIVQRIAKCLTWPQVRWELRDDEKAFDAEQNPIYRQALQQRQIANETAKRILGSATRPSEDRVEELDGEPQKKRARIGEI